MTERVCENCGCPLGCPPWRREQRFCSQRCGVKRGRANNRFNAGLCFDKGKNRWVIWCRDGTLMLYSRAVMAAQLGRLLTPDEIVHHRNEDTTDDRPENLELTTRAAHMEHHRPQLEAALRVVR